jgi:uncharacterized protein YecT (DUF1311 family)
MKKKPPRLIINLMASASIAALLLCGSPIYANELPTFLNGKWQVIEVHINTAASRTTQYYWNDPRLVGRLFSFAPDRISDDAPEAEECISPAAVTTFVTPKILIGKSMGEYGEPAQQATPKDYALDIEEEKSSQVLQIYCGKELWQGTLGAGEGKRGAWIAPLKPDRILLRWYDETLLVLIKVPSDAKPVASFDCAKPAAQTEKAICQSYELASFDKSLSIAYRQLIKQAKDANSDVRSIINDQKAWILKRNECASNEKCILDSMKSRLERIASQNQT